MFTLGCGGSSLVALSGISSPVVLCRLLLSVAPLVWEHSLQGPQASVATAQGLRNCDARA